MGSATLLIVQAGQEDTMDLIGQRLGNYRLVRLLGEGGYAKTYLGAHVLLSMQAAIKVVQAPYSPRDIHRFLHEARAIAQLEHPHIVRVVEGALDERGMAYLVMEYAPGGTLRQRHPPGEALPLERILPYIRQIAAALQYAHDQQLIHRDVKPENVLIGVQGQLLLADFGGALLTQSSSQLSQQDVVGTVAYMAPEQLQGHPRRASDQYALGVMVYEWLTGRPLFTGSVPELIAQHLYAPPRSPRELVPTLSQPVEAVVLRALMKDPKARFASVEAFAAAFAAACQGDVRLPVAPRSFTSFRPVPQLVLAKPFTRQASRMPDESGGPSGPVGGQPATRLPQALLRPIPLPAPLSLKAEAGPAPLHTSITDDDVGLEHLDSTRRSASRFRRLPHSRLLPLHLGLALLVVLLLATGGGLWLTTPRFQQTVVTGKYVKQIRLGVGYDSDFGTVLGESDTFKVGTTVVLIGVVQGWENVVDTQLFQGDTKIAATPQSYIFTLSDPDFPSGNFTASVQISKIGRYQWVIDLVTGSTSFPDGSITFQVTS